MMEIAKYVIEVYEDHAIIRGGLTSEVLAALITISKQEGYTYLVVNCDGSGGFKLVKR